MCVCVCVCVCVCCHSNRVSSVGCQYCVVCMQPEFLNTLECGEGPAFIELWNTNIPARIRTHDVLCQHLECNIRAYFAVYPLRTGVSGRNGAELFHMVVLYTVVNSSGW